MRSLADIADDVQNQSTVKEGDEEVVLTEEEGKGRRTVTGQVVGVASSPSRRKSLSGLIGRVGTPQDEQTTTMGRNWSYNPNHPEEHARLVETEQRKKEKHKITKDYSIVSL